MDWANIHQRNRREAVDCVTSLHRAMQQAGGTVLSYQDMGSMTLLEFITTVAAQNGIRFHYDEEAVAQIVPRDPDPYATRPSNNISGPAS